MGPDRRAALLLVAAAASLVLVRCSAAPSAAAPDVYVLLDGGVSEARVGVDGEYVVEDVDGDRLASGRRLVGGRVRSGPGHQGLDLNGVALDTPTVVLRATDEDLFEYGGRRYAGDLEIRRLRDGRLDVVDVLDIEEYLAGVLFSEMPANFPEEALKAQAVAARTYARWRLQNGHELLRATEADQVYGGVGSGFDRARAIVAATRGLVLEVDGEPLCSYFSSTCGGATIDAPYVFPDRSRKGLTGVPCDACSASPKYRWSRALPLADFARRLDLPRGAVESITSRRDPLGHTIAFDVVAGGRAKRVTGPDLRRLWNTGADGDAERLPSCWLRSISIDKSTLRVEGAGFGHGVGMCQWGAAGLAKSGRDWREILAHYYRGADLVKRW
jgi:stage II sporulation protein D